MPPKVYTVLLVFLFLLSTAIAAESDFFMKSKVIDLGTVAPVELRANDGTKFTWCGSTKVIAAQKIPLDKEQVDIYVDGQTALLSLATTPEFDLDNNNKNDVKVSLVSSQKGLVRMVLENLNPSCSTATESFDTATDDTSQDIKGTIIEKKNKITSSITGVITGEAVQKNKGIIKYAMGGVAALIVLIILSKTFFKKETLNAPAPPLALERVSCQRCGKEIFKGDKFCITCGTNLAPKERFCPNCGLKIKTDSKFCSNCGKAM